MARGREVAIRNMPEFTYMGYMVCSAAGGDVMLYMKKTYMAIH